MNVDQLTQDVRAACLALLPEAHGPQHWLALRAALAFVDGLAAAGVDEMRARIDHTESKEEIFRDAERALDAIRADAYTRSRAFIRDELGHRGGAE